MAANAVAEEYIAQNLEIRLGDSTKRLAFVNSEIERTQNAVREAEEAMTLYVALFGGSVTAVEKYGPGGHGKEGTVRRPGSPSARYSGKPRSKSTSPSST